VTLTMLAEAYAKLGKPMEGLNCLTEAAQIIETTDERYGESELHRLRGDLLNATGEWVAAEENYHLALAVAERQSTKTFELRAATRLACLWRDQGKRSEARDLLAPIYGWLVHRGLRHASAARRQGATWPTNLRRRRLRHSKPLRWRR
jgi:hypothetical protein